MSFGLSVSSPPFVPSSAEYSTSAVANGPALVRRPLTVVKRSAAAQPGSSTGSAVPYDYPSNENYNPANRPPPLSTPEKRKRIEFDSAIYQNSNSMSQVHSAEFADPSKRRRQTQRGVAQANSSVSQFSSPNVSRSMVAASPINFTAARSAKPQQQQQQQHAESASEEFSRVSPTHLIAASFLSAHERENDPRRLEQRKKQIDLGKNTRAYSNYLLFVNRSSRQSSLRHSLHPLTPEIQRVCSKRGWDGLVRQWRRLLHLWDSDGQAMKLMADDQPDLVASVIESESRLAASNNEFPHTQLIEKLIDGDDERQFSVGDEIELAAADRALFMASVVRQNHQQNQNQLNQSIQNEATPTSRFNQNYFNARQMPGPATINQTPPSHRQFNQIPSLTSSGSGSAIVSLSATPSSSVSSLSSPSASRFPSVYSDSDLLAGVDSSYLARLSQDRINSLQKSVENEIQNNKPILNSIPFSLNESFDDELENEGVNIAKFLDL